MVKSGMASSSKATAFDRRFEAAARRVLKRRGVPEARMGEEIERLRKVAPTFDLPTVEELERKLGQLAKPR
jgi:hypothetical protein